MDVINLKHTCTHVSLPYCRYLGIPTQYPARDYAVDDFRVSSVSVVILLIIVILSVFRVRTHVDAKCVVSARKEMKLICSAYMAHLAIELVLTLDLLVSKELLAIQFSLANTVVFILLLFSIFCRSLDLLHTYSIVRALAVVYFVINFVCLYTIVNKPVLVFYNFIGDLGLLFFFVLMELRNLIKTDEDVWAYGCLFLAITALSIAIAFIFVDNWIVCFICDGYLDGMFFFHTFLFCAFLMLHKYWLNTCDFEIESAPVTLYTEK